MFKWVEGEEVLVVVVVVGDVSEAGRSTEGISCLFFGSLLLLCFWRGIRLVIVAVKVLGYIVCM